jgi:hypothetical protein
MSRGDYRLEDDREPEPECPRHRGEPRDGCEACADECDMCAGTGVVRIARREYSIEWVCGCHHGDAELERDAAE